MSKACPEFVEGSEKIKREEVMTNWIKLSRSDYPETDYGLLAAQAEEADWDKLVAYGRRVIEEEEDLIGMIQQDAKYLLGILALEVTKRNENGEKRTLKDFAQAIGKNYSTLRTYAQVAAAYEWDEDEEEVPQGTNLSWSHYKHAAAQPDRQELLQKAVDEEMSATRLREHIHNRREERYLTPEISEDAEVLEESEDEPRLTHEIMEKAAAHFIRDAAIELQKVENAIQTYLDGWDPIGAYGQMEERHGRSDVVYHVGRLGRCISGLIEFKEVLQGCLARGVQRYDN
jgi:hypothetical protein